MLVVAALASAQDRGASSKWEYKAVPFTADEKDATKRLNDLAGDGWEYVGPLGNNLVAFRRPLLTPQERAIKAELEKLQGVWTVASYVIEGKTIRGEDKRSTLTITGDKWVSKWAKEEGGEQVESGIIKIVNAGKAPLAVDLVHSDGPYKGGTTLGIMQVAGDTLKYCWREGERPTEFAAKEGDPKCGLMTYKQQKR